MLIDTMALFMNWRGKEEIARISRVVHERRCPRNVLEGTRYTSSIGLIDVRTIQPNGTSTHATSIDSPK